MCYRIKLLELRNFIEAAYKRFSGEKLQILIDVAKNERNSLYYLSIKNIDKDVTKATLMLVKQDTVA